MRHNQTGRKKIDRNVFPNRTRVLSSVIAHRWGADASKHNSSITKTWQKGHRRIYITKPQVRKGKEQQAKLTYKMCYIFSLSIMWGKQKEDVLVRLDGTMN